MCLKEIPSWSQQSVRCVILGDSFLEIPHQAVSSAPLQPPHRGHLQTTARLRQKETKRTSSLERTTVDLHRTSIQNQMDYSREPKEGKPLQSTEERLDSGLDSLKEEEYQAVAAEIRRLQVACEPPQHRLPTGATGELHEWKTQTTEDGDT